MEPPSLPEDQNIVGEILVRIGPDEPASLFRASLVCKAWRELLTDPGFLRRYRALHRTPPVLGFIHGRRLFPTNAAAAALYAPAFDCFSWVALDCRHGRVLLHTLNPTGLLVWDPISGDQLRLPDVPDLPYNHLTGTVLCAAPDGCDHLDCRAGPFDVVFAATADEDLEEDVISVTWASTYSSATGAWTDPATIHLGPIASSHDVMGTSLLAGGALHFILEDGRRVLRYELAGRGLSVIDAPPLRVGNMALVTAEGGGLGAAGVRGYGLHLWSWRVATGWVQSRVIELDMMISIGLGDPSTRLNVFGYSEDANTVFIRANDGVFTVELKTDRVRRVHDRRRNFDAVIPYASFYTPDHTSGGLQQP